MLQYYISNRTSYAFLSLGCLENNGSSSSARTREASTRRLDTTRRNFNKPHGSRLLREIRAHPLRAQTISEDPATGENRGGRSQGRLTVQGSERRSLILMQTPSVDQRSLGIHI